MRLIYSFLILCFLFNSAWAEDLDYFSAPSVAVCGATTQCTANAVSIKVVQKSTLKQENHPKQIIKYYFSPQCPHCRELKRTLLPKLRQKFSGAVDIQEYDILANPLYLQELTVLTQRYRSDVARIPSVLIGDTFLVGTHEITLEKISSLIQVVPPAMSVAVVTANVLVTQQLSFPALSALIFAALLDGINPCAFATILFFVTYLTFLKKDRKYIFQIGLAFMVGVFICYFLLGLGIFHILLKLKTYDLISFWFSKALGVVALVLGFLSLYDFYVYKMTGRSGDMILQLPSRLKKIIHRVIRTGVDP